MSLILFRRLILLILINIILSDLIIQESGVNPIGENDMALIFFITLQNIGDNNYQILVSMQECCLEMKDVGKDCSSMYLIGGNMDILKPKTSTNVTLLYPNLYLYNRKGTCKISIKYRNQYGTKEIIRDVCFHTELKCEKMKYCNSEDLNQMDGCSPQDCTIKYSGNKNFFNHDCNKCEKVPECVSSSSDVIPDLVYSVISNQCKNINNTVTKNDLEQLEKKLVMTNYAYNIKNHVICHHGTVDSDEVCNCFEGWKTTLDDEDYYTPRLAFYHMCNIEVGSWNTINKSKLETTALVIAIFAITITSKILILMCILNWCYKFVKKPEKPCTHPNILHEDVLSHKCTCQRNDDNSERNQKTKNHIALKAETVHVSFYPCDRSPSACTCMPIKISKSSSSTATKSTTKRLRFCDSPKCSSPERSYYKTSSVSYSCTCSSPPLQTELSRSSEENDDDFEIEFSDNEPEEDSLAEEESKETTSAATGEEESLETVDDTSAH